MEPLKPAAPTYPKLTAESWKTLNDVNNQVNSSTKYTSDAALYGRSDFWDYANQQGDCEDYALAKYRELVKAGWPKESLRLNLVRLKDGEGHAVLTADMDGGTYVLDNRFGNVKGVAPDGSDYDWISRQIPGQYAWERTQQPGSAPADGTVTASAPIPSDPNAG